MKRFIEGEDRSQSTLLPECLDDYVADDNPVLSLLTAWPLCSWGE